MTIQNGARAPRGSACLEKAELAFRDALQATFGPLDWLPVADGTIHRFRVPDDKAGTLNGWYVLHLDGIASGAFGSWKAGGSSTWSSRKPADPMEAELIRQRVEQIRRYEMLRDNKELLEQITFTTSNPTSRCIDPDSEDEHEAAGLGVERFSHARDSEWNVDEEDEDDETQVTETEAELIAMISAQAKVSPCPHPETRDLNPQP